MSQQPVPRVMLFGSTGQLGRELSAVLGRHVDLVLLRRADADFTHPGALAAVVRGGRPDMVINAAAYTQVDRAESEPDLARMVNADAVAALAQACREVGALLVHYSTDYVYDGSGTRPWTEEDRPDPINTYGKTKLAGEQAIAASGCRHVTLRISWLFSPHGQNFLKTMVALAETRPQLRVVADQIGGPTSAALVAAATATILPQVVGDPAKQGTYNLAAAGEVSWYDYARYTIDAARQAGLPIIAEAITPVATADYPTPARRPLNSRLDTTKLRSTFSVALPDWRRHVLETVGQLARAA